MSLAVSPRQERKAHSAAAQFLGLWHERGPSMFISLYTAEETVVHCVPPLRWSPSRPVSMRPSRFVLGPQLRETSVAHRVHLQLVFPKDSSLSRAAGFTMLGLGDIMCVVGFPCDPRALYSYSAHVLPLSPHLSIPGVFLALCLRLDFSLHLSRNPTFPLLRTSPFPKPYFLSTLVAYIAGLLTTIVVMHTFKAAQPALLYLSPACVGAVALVGWWRGETAEVWKWSDGGDDEAEMELRKKRKEEGKDEEDQTSDEVDQEKESEQDGVRRRATPSMAAE